MPLGRRNRENHAPVTRRSCVHCASEIPDGAASPLYCCAGCEAVAALLRAEDLTRYYELAGGAVTAVGALPMARGHAWLEPILSAQTDADTQTCEVDVQGIHCAACVWLMNETFRRRPGGVGIVVNPALGKVRLAWRRGQFDVAGWIDAVERFGYQFGPSRKTSSRAAGGITWRLGVAAALAMNVMLFSVSVYFGLSPADGSVYRLFAWLALVLSTTVVAVGGWPFFRSAAVGLRNRILHLDLPIAMGIALVYLTCVAEFGRGQGREMAYFDTLNVFITLMLLGRFLQQRVIDRNRQMLLADDGAEGLFVRRVGGDGRLDVVRAPQVQQGDRLLIAPGELVPVEARLVDLHARLSTDWINGESAVREAAAGETLAAGSFNGGDGAFTVVALQPFAGSPLGALLRQTSARAGAARHLRFWDRLARRWVVTVLSVASAGFLLWWPRGTGRALDVAVALLVVSCPCAIGIALPLAAEIVQARLRRSGFFVRSADLLDRLERVRKVVFDKTGTLTLQRLELSGEGNEPLPADVGAVAYNLACRSAHPVAACVAAALARAGARFDSAAQVVEVPGAGLEWRRPDGVWRLGRAPWAAPQETETGTVLARDGADGVVVLARFATREMMRPGAASDLAALGDAGYQVHIVSGDTPARVAALAARLGISPLRAHGGRTPQDKAADLAALGGADAMFIGDGANDALAFGQALCAGTVAIERPVLPGRSDFFIVGESLAPVRAALAAAQELRAVTRRVLAISLAYNVLALGTALAGHMTPLRAAIFMPLSSLSILLFTVASLRARGGRPSLAPLLPMAEAAR
jgi:P-type Cu2+ transporter